MELTMALCSGRTLSLETKWDFASPEEWFPLTRFSESLWVQFFTLAVCPPSGIMLFIRKASSGWLKRKKADWPKHSMQP